MNEQTVKNDIIATDICRSVEHKALGETRKQAVQTGRKSWRQRIGRPWARGRVRGQGAELEGRRQELGADDKGQRGSFPRASGSRENFTFYLSSIADGVLVTWLYLCLSLTNA